MSEPVRVTLTAPVRYATADGGMRQASFVQLSAPSSSAFKTAFRVKQELMRAILSESRRVRAIAAAAGEPIAEPEEGDQRPDGGAYLKMLAGSECDLALLGQLVRDLIVDHGVAKLDGEVSMTPLLLDALSLADFEAVVGEYLVTFPLA